MFRLTRQEKDEGQLLSGIKILEEREGSGAVAVLTYELTLVSVQKGSRIDSRA